MKIDNLFLKHDDFSKNYIYISLILFPISLLAGNLVINIFVITNAICFIFILAYKKNINFNLKNKFFILLILFFLSLIINLFNTQNLLLSLPRVIKFFFIIFFIFSFKEIFHTTEIEKVNNIFKIWAIIFFAIILDLIYEFFMGQNIIGLSSKMSDRGRLSSFTGDESVIGAYFHGYVLFFLTYLFHKYPDKNYLNIFFVVIVLIISFLIGERSNFIKTFIIVVIFSTFTYKISTKLKIICFSLLIISLITLLSFNKEYKKRYILQLPNIFEKNAISKYLDNSNYGKHYNVAKKIFYDHPYFGVGIKNFRIESYNRKYKTSENSWTGGTTHPHQIHYELLSETGLFGYSVFLLFMFLSIYYSLKKYFVNKDKYLLSSILYLLSTLIPVLPSGSFFTTYLSAIFWINYVIMISFCERPKF